MMTDLYQLTMMNNYFNSGRHEDIAVFDVFFRKNTKYVSYSIFAGLEQVIEYIKKLKFTNDDLKYLKSLNLFSDEFLEYLRLFRFTGSIYAMEEGSVVFPQEPLIRVEAPLAQAQLMETAILTMINYQTLIASKASHVVSAAQGAKVAEFGLRRAQERDAGFYGARATYIAGVGSTSNVLAGEKLGIPVFGTHSHSYVMAFDSEFDAFMNFARAYPDHCLLLVDTYNTLESGIPNAIKTFDYLKKKGHVPGGIRLDSGDLAYFSKKAREMLDAAGHTEAKIFASGDLDEYVIADLIIQGAKIDSYGVGTKLITGGDTPALGGVYKMSALQRNGEIIPKMKISDNILKMTYPGIKTV
ncbi:MAG: nicotinate phosphoribosyltransferase, partial [Clostridia bacterium]|nr:nicotinate phosphoribosyltransferase [Clostridia bacterium]